jgi:hypothetical protein
MAVKCFYLRINLHGEMATSLHVLASCFLLLVVNVNLEAMPPQCKYRYLENKTTCTGEMKKMLRRGILSEVIVGRSALEVCKTDLTHVEGSWYEGQNNLTSLKISFNRVLKELRNNSFIYFPSLENLDLSHNQIESLNVFVFHPLTTLNELKLDHNNLQILEAGVFSSQKNLRILSLSYNRLESLRNEILSSLVMLEELHVNNNRLNNLDSRCFVSLETMTFLNLSGNHLNVLPASVFTYQKKLTELHLDKNNISTLSAELFLPTTQIEILSFSGNKIRNISSAVLEPLIRLKQFDAMECPIECDCLFKNFYHLCAVRSIKTNITCEGSKYDLSVTLQQMECGIMNKSKIVLLVIIGLFIVGMLTQILLGCISRPENFFDKRRTTEYVNEYDYVEHPLDAKRNTDDDVRPRERQRYMSVLHVALNVYDYLRPLQGQLFNIRTSDIQQRRCEPEAPETSAPSRPTSDLYYVAM